MGGGGGVGASMLKGHTQFLKQDGAEGGQLPRKEIFLLGGWGVVGGGEVCLANWQATGVRRFYSERKAKWC